MRLASLLFAVLALSACAPKVDVTALPGPVDDAERTAVIALLSEDLRDPASAEFRRWQGFDLSNGDRIVCGQINATNGFGGFVGFSAFFVRLTGAAVQRMYIDDGSSSAGPAAIGCAMAAQGTIGIAGATRGPPVAS